MSEKEIKKYVGMFLENKPKLGIKKYFCLTQDKKGGLPNVGKIEQYTTINIDTGRRKNYGKIVGMGIIKYKNEKEMHDKLNYLVDCYIIKERLLEKRGLNG